MGIRYEKGDMFELAPKGAILTHSCNAQGRWGSGIANQFAVRYPGAYVEYRQYCLERFKGGPVPGTEIKKTCVGDGFIVHDVSALDDVTKIGCLITSKNYGKYKDSPEQILKATEQATRELLVKVVGAGVYFDTTHTIYSPKINSGLFAVPWEKTEEVLNEVLNEFPTVQWVVCEY